MKSPVVRLWLSYILCLIAVSAFYAAFHRESFSIWPLAKGATPPQVYSDSLEGGFSTVETFESDSAFAMRAVLNSGIYHPYAGVRFPLVSGKEKLSLRGVDFSSVDSTVITFRASSDVALILFTADPNISKFGDPLSFRPLRMEVPATRHYTEHRLSLSGIRTNPVWFSVQGIDPDSAYYIDHVVSVAVESGKGTLLGLPTEMEILKWDFFGENLSVKRLCLFILILVTGLFFWGQVKFYGKRKKERSIGSREQRQ